MELITGLIRFFKNNMVTRTIIKMIAAYFVFCLFLQEIGDAQMLEIFKYFCIIQIPVYFIARYCLQRSFTASIIFVILYRILKIIWSEPDAFDYYWRDGLARMKGEDLLNYVFYAPGTALSTFLFVAIIAHLIIKFSKNFTSKYAAERTIRSINYFWWILPLYSVIAQNDSPIAIVVLIIQFMMIVQYFVYKHQAKLAVAKAKEDEESKEMIYYTSMNNILFNPKSDLFIPIGKVLFGNIVGNMEHHRIITSTISDIFRIFPYEYIKYSEEHPFPCPVKKFILFIDSKDRALCENKKYADAVLEQLKQIMAKDIEILVVSVLSKEVLTSTYFEDEAIKCKMEYRSYPSRKEINSLDIEYFIYSKELSSTEKKIRQAIWDLDASFPQEDKFSFLHSQLQMIHKTFNPTELFYQLLRMMEYILHYRALYVLTKSNIETVESFDSFSIGGWANMQYKLDQVAPKYMEDDPVHQAYLTILSLLKKQRFPSSSTFVDIVQSVIELRNKYLGHGSITFSVSDELLEALMVLTKEMVFMFQHDVSRLEQSSAILIKINKITKQIPCRLEDGSLLSYWIHDEEASFDEYLNYTNGHVTRNGNVFTIQLSMEGGF